jgi:hypothetical protein
MLKSNRLFDDFKNCDIIRRAQPVTNCDRFVEQFGGSNRIYIMNPQSASPDVLPFIHVIRGQRVILDSDLARLYGVPTKHLNQQVRRNQRRFPADFAFVLTDHEARRQSQFVTASPGRNWRKPPIAFTEHGAVMAANVLNSEQAVYMSVQVVRAFIRLRRAAVTYEGLARKVADIENTVRENLAGQNKKISVILRAVTELMKDADSPPKPQTGNA